MKTVPLGKLTTLISSGSTPLGGSKIYLSNGPVMLIRSQNVLMQSLDLEGIAFITKEIAEKMKRTVVITGDVLLNITGASIGRVATFELEGIQANVNQHVCIIRPISELLYHRYLMHFISQPNFQTYIDSTQDGGTRQALTFEKISNFQVPLPPIAEQRRIAAILDKAEELRELRRQALRGLDAIAQSIFIEMFGDPVRNPKGWNRVPFSELLAQIESGRSPNCLDRPAADGEWGVLKLGAVTWCEYNPYENKALPPNEKPDAALEVKKGDLLFTRKNTYELVAACALVRSTLPRLLLPDLIFRFRLKSDASVDLCFLHQLLTHPTKRREIQKLASGSASSMPNISKTKLQAALLEMPPLSLQQEFGRRIESIQQLKTTHRESLAQLDTLFASLQHRAFRGEL